MRIYFKEKTHQYFNEEHEEYISVSKLFKKLEPFVDWDKKARKYAKDQTEAGNPLSFMDVKRKWERKRDLAAQAGTIYHGIREDELLQISNPEFYNVPCGTKSCPVSEGIKWSLPETKLENNKVYPELIIYDHDAKICGQSDKVIVTNNTINVWDYKTDEEIKFEGWSSEWKKADKYLPPINHLEVCNGNMYSVKMSIYMYMLWKQNKHLKIGDLIIEHIKLKRDSEGIPVLENGKPVVIGKPKQINLVYRRSEIKNIFEFYQAGKLK